MTATNRRRHNDAVAPLHVVNLPANLDNLAADAEAAGEPVADYVRQSIVDPNAVIAQGYQPGVMPETFGDTLKPDELDALVAYLSGEGDS